jgi:hypothetical protein
MACLLKFFLQLLFVLLLSLRCRALLLHFRRVWQADRRDPLAAAFRRELRRRGLLTAPPLR